MFRQDHPYLFFMAVITAFICTTMIAFMLTIYQLVPKKNRISGGNVGVVQVDQTISQSDHILNCLKRFDEADNIKAIIVRINSPGGEVGPSQEIYEQIRKVSGRKKIIASMGSIATSGGYYIASAADKIIANKGTLTGSIGVIMSFTNVQGLMKKVGLGSTTVKSGLYKDIGSPVRKMSAEETEMLQSLSDNIHEQFIADIAEGRNMAESEIRNLADGRIFTGQQAVEVGLIDSLGNFDDAVEYAGKIANIKGKLNLVYPVSEPRSLYELLGLCANSVIGKILNCNVPTKFAFN